MINIHQQRVGGVSSQGCGIVGWRNRRYLSGLVGNLNEGRALRDRAVRLCPAAVRCTQSHGNRGKMMVYLSNLS